MSSLNRAKNYATMTDELLEKYRIMTHEFFIILSKGKTIQVSDIKGTLSLIYLPDGNVLMGEMTHDIFILWKDNLSSLEKVLL